MSGPKPDVARVALDTQRMQEMTVGVGVGNTPDIVPVRHGLAINDELALTILRNDGSKIVRRAGRVLEVHHFRGSVVVKDRSTILTELKQVLPGDERLTVACFRDGGCCAVIDDGRGGLRSFIGIGLSIQVRDYTIDIFGSSPSDHA